MSDAAKGTSPQELAQKGCRVTGMDQYVPEVSVQPGQIDFIRWNLDRKEFPVNVSVFDQILMLDIIEHLKEPERFMDELRCAAACKRPEVIITTANIGFAVTRFMLLLRAIQLRQERHPGRDAYAALYLPFAPRAARSIRLQGARSAWNSGTVSEGTRHEHRLEPVDARQSDADLFE